MRVLVTTNALPTPEHPASGTFIAVQVKALREAGVGTEVLFVDRRSAGWKAYAELPSLVREGIARFRPDVVHAMYGGVLSAATAAATSGVPFVVSFCGSDLLGSPESGAARRVMSSGGVALSLYAARRADAIIVKSANLAAALPASTRSKVTVVPSGIDLTVFRPMDRDACRAELGWSGERFHVLFASSAGDPVKRPQLAREAVARLVSRGIPAELHEMNGVPHLDVPRWLNASDGVLLTSSREGSPNIIREALACNVPAVSVDVGDTRERLAGVEGCYLAADTAEDLAEKLARVWDARARVDGRSCARTFDLASTAAAVVGIYERIRAGRTVSAA